jgi:hypothetical protein
VSQPLDYRIWSWDRERPLGEFPELSEAAAHCHLESRPWSIPMQRPLHFRGWTDDEMRAGTAETLTVGKVTLRPAFHPTFGRIVTFASREDQAWFAICKFDVQLKDLGRSAPPSPPGENRGERK